MNDYITDYLAHQDHVQDYLCHYGVKGMKWGVRHYRTKSIIQQARVNRRTKKLKRKSKGDSNLIGRRVNDHRRGRIAQIQRKQAHYEAKAKYLSDPSSKNKAALSKARKERILKNGVQRMVVSSAAQGQYGRLRDSGKTKTQAFLQTAGTTLAINAARNAASNVGKKYVQDKMIQKMDSDLYRYRR